jgi:serine/threonine protein kinase
VRVINWFGKPGKPKMDGEAATIVLPPAAPAGTGVDDDRTIIMRASPPTLIAGAPRAAPQTLNAFDAATMLAAPGVDVSAATIVWNAAPNAPGHPDLPLPPGTVLNQRYEVIKPIGRGGFSYVYLCQHVRNGRLNAVKEAYGAGCGRAAAQVIGAPSELGAAKEALLREVSAISRLNHPGVVRFEDVFEANGTLCFAMDFVEGEPLSAVLGRRRGVSVETFGGVAERLLDAVEALHGADVLHGDIKPANIIVRQDKSLVLIDFGTAARLSDLHYAEAIVTPGFSAPERYRAGADVGAWSDVYSCAATLAAAMAGAPPPDARGMTAEAMAAFLATAQFRMPRQARWLAGLERGLADAVDTRSSSVGELRAAMGFAVRAAPVEAPTEARNDGSSVFISYSHRDGEAVEAYVRAIQRLGGGVWIDRKGIQPGSRAWAAEILKGMRGAQAVLLFSSANSMASENVKEEIYLAKELKKPIVVARLDDAPFSDDVLLFLTRTQHIPATTMPAPDFGAAVIQALNSQQAQAA